MKKRLGFVLIGILAGLFLLFGALSYLYSGDDVSGAAVSGNSIKDSVGRFYEMSSVNERLLLLGQIIFVIVIIISIFFIIKKIGKKQTLFKKDYMLAGEAKRSRTDLDVLYEMLKNKKEIDLRDVERVFQVSPEVAIGWAKVLEDGDLIEIDYPRFGKPILRLFEEDGEDEKEVVGAEVVEKKEGEEASVVAKKSGSALKNKIMKFKRHKEKRVLPLKKGKVVEKKSHKKEGVVEKKSHKKKKVARKKFSKKKR